MPSTPGGPAGRACGITCQSSQDPDLWRGGSTSRVLRRTKGFRDPGSPRNPITWNLEACCKATMAKFSPPIPMHQKEIGLSQKSAVTGNGTHPRSIHPDHPSRQGAVALSAWISAISVSPRKDFCSSWTALGHVHLKGSVGLNRRNCPHFALLIETACGLFREGMGPLVIFGPLPHVDGEKAK